MLFNSYSFIFIFLPLTFFVYFFLNRYNKKISYYFLLISNLIFYGVWNILYLPLLIVSIAFNYYIGSEIIKHKTKKLLKNGIIVNIILLGFFKYANFLIDNINFLTNLNVKHLNIILPLAISFYTFQQIAYLVDCYRGKIKTSNFLDYALFVTFFPQLIAGPITYFNEIIPQFYKNFFNINSFQKGIFLFAIGLFKKVIIADTFAVWADSGFNSTMPLSFFDAWASSLSYTFQLYYDFSGYTDMAIGIALLFNIKLPINFNSPYKALSIQEFWRRWHITLSRFLKDYIYIPLGGNREGEFKTYRNLFITFLLGGIWHGAGWTFVIWGALHGFGLIIHRAWKRLGFTLPSILAWFITFIFINITWVFFRAKDLDNALNVLRGMVNFHSIGTLNLTNFIWIALFTILIFAKNSNQLVEINLNRNTKLYLTTLLILFSLMQLFNLQLLDNVSSKFIYFEF